MAHVCSFCDSNGFRQQLPRLKLAWHGWKSTPAYDGLLQMMSDDDGIYFLCNDCEISYAFFTLVDTRNMAISSRC